jgi:hypothetical protein
MAKDEVVVVMVVASVWREMPTRRRREMGNARQTMAAALFILFFLKEGGMCPVIYLS